MPNLNCEVCGENFTVPPYRAKTARFCSQKCGGKWHCTNRLVGNDKSYMAGNRYAKGRRPVNAFTPAQVKGEKNHKWVAAVTITCEFCHKPFPLKPHAAKGRRFCSRSCFTQSGAFAGEKSPCYVGGKNSRRGRSWRRIRLQIVGAQNGKCADCPKHLGLSLPVHHIKPWREFDSEAEANKLSNLVGLCQSCHMRREAAYGRESKAR